MKTFLILALLLLNLYSQSSAAAESCVIRATAHYVDAQGRLGSAIQRESSEFIGMTFNICSNFSKSSNYMGLDSRLVRGLCTSFGPVAIEVKAIYKTTGAPNAVIATVVNHCLSYLGHR